MLRTEELESVHRFDGTEQYFGRQIDFGYSFSVEETYRKWGRQETLADYVRIIRMIRPDVVVTMRPEGEMGGAHHQAQAQDHRRGVPPGRRSGRVSRADQGRPAAVAGPEALLPGIVHDRRQRGARAGSAGGENRRLRPAARADLLRDRVRGAQPAQVPGDGAAAVPPGAAERLVLPARRHEPAGRRDRAPRPRCSTGSTPSIGGLARFARVCAAGLGQRPVGDRRAGPARPAGLQLARSGGREGRDRRRPRAPFARCGRSCRRSAWTRRRASRSTTG